MGFYHIANNSNVPILLFLLDFSNKKIGIINEIIPTGDIEKDIQFTYSIIYQNDYKKYNISPEETDFMIDVVRLVKGANIALLLKEQIDGSFKGSLRSRNNFNVQEIASIFNGGGHKAASGFSSELSEQENIQKIKNEIRT